MSRIRIVAVLALVALVGCGTAAGFKTNSPQYKVLGISSDYNAMLAIAVAYNKLPRCGPAAPKICSKQNVVVILRQTNRTASAALTAAENMVREPGIAASKATLSVTAAREAVTLMSAILQQYGIFKGG